MSTSSSVKGSVVPNRRGNDDGTRSVGKHSSASNTSVVKLAEVQRRQKILDIQAEYDLIITERMDELEDKEELLAKATNKKTAEKLQEEISSLKKTIMRLQRDCQRKLQNVEAAFQLEVERAKVENEVENGSHQDFDGDNQGSHVPSWIEKADAFQNNDDGNREPSHTPEPDDNSVVGTPAKDDMILHLLQSQLHLMQKANTSTADRRLPDFSGDPSDWGNFISSYERSTTKFGLGDGENLARLQTALKGDARDAVKHLMANTRNVKRIMEVLQQRFGRAEYVLDYLVEAVKACPKPDPVKPRTVVDFGTSVENLVVNICAYEEDDYMNNKSLVKELVEKLPLILKGNWFEYLEQDAKRKVNLNEFSKWLGFHVRVALRQVKPTVPGASKQDEKQGQRPRRSFGTVNAAEGEDEIKSCPACKKNHGLDTCWQLKKKPVNERWNIVKEAKVCYSCFKSGHITRNCPDAKECGRDGCKRRHNTLLHSTARNEGDNVSAASTPAKVSSDQLKDVKVGSISLSIVEGTDGPLPIVPVRVRGNGGQQRVVYALLDSGATRTLIHQDLASELELDGESTRYSFRTMAGKIVRNENAKKVNLCISGRYKNAKPYQLADVITVETIGLAPYSLNVDEAKARWPHLHRYKGPSLKNVTPQLVIGGDHGYLLMHRTLLYSTETEPVGMRTVLGWTLQGKLNSNTAIGSGFCVSGLNMDEVLKNLIEESFQLEDFGVKSEEKRVMSRQDKAAMDILEATTKQRDDNRWETGLLWKDNQPFPTDTYDEAYIRLRKTQHRMRKDPNYAMVYSNKIEEYLEKKYIRKLTQGEASTRTPRTCYIPHFGVVNPNKPGKFRLVFDAAAKTDDVSLNDRLLTGPDFYRPLPAIVWNFRRHPVVLCGDIEDMFHRIYVREQDRDSQRFLWGKDNSTTPDEYEMLVLIFGATSSPASAIYVKDKNAERFKDKFPDAVDKIKRDMFVDDLMSGAETELEAIRLRQEITGINGSGGFIIKKWLSNSKAVMDTIPEALRLSSPKALTDHGTQTERVLGLWWDPSEDVFKFKLNFAKVAAEILEGARPTKRQMCSLIMSLFDPLGFVAHFRIKGMILFQEVWRSGIGWDDDIPEDIYHGWKSWLGELHHITEVRVPRCYSFSLARADEVQLHTLVDASSQAIAAVSYLRIQTGDLVEVAFVAARVRVAPLKTTTIPRLELNAAVMGSKLAHAIAADLDTRIAKKFYWTDSVTVWSWITSESSRLKMYEGNRVGRIQAVSSPSEWNWIGTADNVADDATRHGKSTDLTSDSRWLRGPEFLLLEPASWPKRSDKEALDATGVITATTALECQDESGLESGLAKSAVLQVIPDPGRFSSFYRLQRATAAVIACGKYWIGSVRERGNRTCTPWTSTGSARESNLTVEQLSQAEKLIVLAAQLEINLKEKNGVSKLLKLRLDEDGIIRVLGRLDHASCIPEETRMPILLPRRNHIVDLIVDDAHKQNMHTGRNTVYNALRQKFWIPDGRHAVRRSWTRCNFCRLKKAKPICPEMGMLPNCRVAGFQPPFTYTGVDMFGPIEVTVGRRHEKRWGMLFTCMVTRAVHLEVTSGLSADDTMLAVSRFVDGRGLPRHMYSDNGTNFQAVGKEVGKKRKYLGLEWHYIPPASPHMGGAWETMVKQVKRVLFNILSSKYPKDQVLLTAMKAVENVVNSRPLAYVSGDAGDPEAITPNHFLRGIGVASGGASSQAALSSSANLTEEGMEKKQRWNKQWEQAQELANKFWKRWSVEVLPDLLRRDKWNESKEPVGVGDVVIMVDDLKPRNMWSKALVTKTFPGSDGVVRVVEVRTRNFATKTVSAYKRAVSKICRTGIRVSDLATALVSKSGGR